MYVKLISSDGHEFIVKRDHALTSGTIKVGCFFGSEASNIHLLDQFFRPCCQDLVNSRRTRPTRSTSARSHLTFCKRCACISPTRCDTRTARLKSQSFRSSRKSHSSSSWPPTSSTANQIKEYHLSSSSPAYRIDFSVYRGFKRHNAITLNTN